MHVTMTYPVNHAYAQAWSHSPDALTRQMRLCSISENASTAAFQSQSDNSLSNGWGNSMSRKSYKMDLSSLAGHDSQQSGSNNGATMKTEDDWGFFIDS
jgi:hypothetical protein